MSEVNNLSRPSKKTAKTNKKISKQLQAQQKHPTQIIVKKPNASIPLDFPAIYSQLHQIAKNIIDAKIRKRYTLVLAKIAKENFLKLSQSSDEKGSTHQSNKNQLFQEALLSKPLHEINNHYCSELSTDLIKSLTFFLKEQKISAKVMANVMIVQKPKMGFNISGLCYWDQSTDGTINISKKLGPMISKATEPKQQPDSSQSKLSSEPDSMSNNHQGLLVVAIYFCKYEQNFKSKSLSLNSSQ